VQGQVVPTEYEIRISGPLDPARAEWFGNLALTLEHTAGGDTITVLSGPVTDRSALFGILSRVRDLGLTLISVNPIGPATQESAGDELPKEQQ
jgi:hypothetical protein